MLNATAKVESDYPTEKLNFIRLLSDNQNLSEPQQTKGKIFWNKKNPIGTNCPNRIKLSDFDRNP